MQKKIDFFSIALLNNNGAVAEFFSFTCVFEMLLQVTINSLSVH